MLIIRMCKAVLFVLQLIYIKIKSCNTPLNPVDWVTFKYATLYDNLNVGGKFTLFLESCHQSKCLRIIGTSLFILLSLSITLFVCIYVSLNLFASYKLQCYAREFCTLHIILNILHDAPKIQKY